MTNASDRPAVELPGDQNVEQVSSNEGRLKKIKSTPLDTYTVECYTNYDAVRHKLPSKLVGFYQETKHAY